MLKLWKILARRWKLIIKTFLNRKRGFDDLCQEIDNVLFNLSKEIKKYDALSLLHRAFWTNAYLHIHPLSEKSTEREQILAAQRLEFIQNYIASIEVDSTELPPVDDKGWKKIEQLTESFNDYMPIFFILRSKEMEGTQENYSFEKDALFTQDMMHSLLMRGHRYSAHEILHAKDLLLPHNKIFQEIFGVSTDKFVEELEKIYHSFTFGFGEAFHDLIQFKEESLEKTRDVDFSKLTIKDKNKTLFREALESIGLGQKADDVFDRALGLGICNLAKTTELPVNLLDLLSWKEGEEKEFWTPGQYAGWPLRVTPLKKRPFLNIQGQYYCFDILNLFDNLYRTVEKTILHEKPEYREEWNKIQKDTSEILPFKYLNKLLPTAKIYHPVYYGKKGSRTEVDGILIYDDVLLIVEIKAGALDTGSSILDYEKRIKRLQELISDPARQANRFHEYLKANNNINIYDGNSRCQAPILYTKEK